MRNCVLRPRGLWDSSRLNGISIAGSRQAGDNRLLAPRIEANSTLRYGASLRKLVKSKLNASILGLPVQC
jgi:hypothetical protein